MIEFKIFIGSFLLLLIAYIINDVQKTKHIKKCQNNEDTLNQVTNKLNSVSDILKPHNNTDFLKQMDEKVSEVSEKVNKFVFIKEQKEDQEIHNKNRGKDFENSIYVSLQEEDWKNNCKSYLIAQPVLDTVDKYTPKPDILFLHQTGIYIIECKCWGGTVYTNSNYMNKFFFLDNNTKVYKPDSPLHQLEKQKRAIMSMLKENNIQTTTFKKIVVFARETDIKNIEKIESEKAIDVYTKIVSEDELFDQIHNYIDTFDYQHSKAIPSEQLEKIFDLLKQNSQSSDVLM